MNKLKSKVYGAFCNGNYTYIKAFKKANAVKKFKELDKNIKVKDVYLTKIISSHQSPVEYD